MPQYLCTEDFIKAIALYNAQEYFKKSIVDTIDGDQGTIELAAKFLAYITVFLQKKKKVIYFPSIVDTFFKKQEKFYKIKESTGLETVYMLTKTKISTVVRAYFDKMFYSCQSYELPHFYQEAKEQLKNKDK